MRSSSPNLRSITTFLPDAPLLVSALPSADRPALLAPASTDANGLSLLRSPQYPSNAAIPASWRSHT